MKTDLYLSNKILNLKFIFIKTFSNFIKTFLFKNYNIRTFLKNKKKIVKIKVCSSLFVLKNMMALSRNIFIYKIKPFLFCQVKSLNLEIATLFFLAITLKL